MHGAQRVCRLWRRAKLPRTGPANERYAQFVQSIDIATDTNGRGQGTRSGFSLPSFHAGHGGIRGEPDHFFDQAFVPSVTGFLSLGFRPHPNRKSARSVRPLNSDH
jgi:hypothetical protein